MVIATTPTFVRVHFSRKIELKPFGFFLILADLETFKGLLRTLLFFFIVFRIYADNSGYALDIYKDMQIIILQPFSLL